MQTFNILDVVAVTEDLPDQNVRRGMVGTIVELWAEGVFEVEFSDNSGQAYAFASLRAEQIMKLYFRRDEAA